MSNGLSINIQAGVGEFRTALEFNIHKSIAAIFGPSGSGKTTVLKCIAGLLNPVSGSIVMDDDVWYDAKNGVNATPQKRKVGMVFQNPSLFPHLNVEKNISFGISEQAPEIINSRVQHLAEIMQIPSLLGRLPSEISGGQAQRVAIARALAPQPRLLLLDEPFSALDAELRAELGSRLQQILSEEDLTIVLVTHFVDEAKDFASVTVAMPRGK